MSVIISAPEVSGVDCSERDLLDKQVEEATLKWAALDQTPLPDVSVPGGVKEADDLTRRRDAAREILSRARTAYQRHLRTHSLLELIAVSLFRWATTEGNTYLHPSPSPF
jgi:hypothetical protein